MTSAKPLCAEEIAAIKTRAQIALADPDEERECLRCRETMAAPDFEHEAAPVCDGCAHWLAAELAEDAERLLAIMHSQGEEIARLRAELLDATRDVVNRYIESTQRDSIIEQLRSELSGAHKENARLRDVCAKVAQNVADLAARTTPTNEFHKSRLIGERMAAEEIAEIIRAQGER